MPKPRLSSLQRDLGPYLILVLLPLALLGSCCFGSRALVPAGQTEHFPAWSQTAANPPAWDVLYWDDLAQLLPWQAEARRAIEDGRVPLWNHDQGCGAPLMANTQTSSLSPYWLAAQAVGIVRAQALMALLQLWLAGIGTYLFFRHWRLGKLPCLLAATTYQLSGWSLCWTEFPNRHAPVAWFPVCLWLMSRALGVGPASGESTSGGSAPVSLRARLAAALGLAVSLLSAHLQFEFYLFLGVGLYAVSTLNMNGDAVLKIESGADRALMQKLTRKLIQNRMALFVIIVIAAILIAAPELIPSVELGRWSARLIPVSWENYTARMHYSMPLVWLAQAFVPGFFGYPSQGTVPAFVSPTVPPVPHFSADFYEFCVFVGSVPLLLALNGVARGRNNRLTLFLLLLGAISLLMALGTVVNTPLYFGLPGFSAMAGTGRMLYLYAFSTAGLAAIGLQALLTTASETRADGRESRSPAVYVTLLHLLIVGVVGAGFCMAAALWLVTMPGAVSTNDALQVLADRVPQALLPVTVLLAAAGCCVGISLRPAAKTWFAGALVIFSTLQLLQFGFNVVQTAPADSVFPITPAIAAIRNEHPFRIMGFARGWTVGLTGGPAGPEDLKHPSPLPPNSSSYYGLSSLESYNSLNSRAYTNFVTRLQGKSPFPVENGNMALLSNADSPLVEESGTDLVASAGPVSGAHLSPVSRPGGLFLYRVTDAQPPARVESPDSNRIVSVPKIARWKAGLISIPAAEGPGRLIVLDAALPGWSANIDGRPAPIGVYEGLFKTLQLEMGKHEVTLEYRPLSFRLGIFLSAMTLSAMAAIAVEATIRKRSGESPRLDPSAGGIPDPVGKTVD